MKGKKLKETPDRAYKDDPKDFAQSSDLAERGKTGEYAGGGPGSSSTNFTPAKGEQAWQKGSGKTPDDDEGKNVTSRSADPGQSSYGGFKNEGPATEDGHRKP